MVEARIADVLADPAVRDPVKLFLRSAMDRDPVDAGQDAMLLCELLVERRDAVLLEDRRPEPIAAR